ncbi:MAG: hypothetical protein H7Y04_06110, partial [Verrucomicrobia bacterium]|nr:hypothetical protein [Cytophagales bacterium]
FVSEGIDAMIARQLANQQERREDRQARENREKYQELVFEEKIWVYSDIVITAVAVDVGTGQVTLTNDKDERIVTEDTFPPESQKARIIQDKNGDQWVLEKGKEPQKVAGGGLIPGGNAPLARADRDLLKKALKQVRNQYSQTLVTSSEELKRQKQQPYEQIVEDLQSIFSPATPTGTDSEEIIFFEADTANTTGYQNLDEAAANYILSEKALFINKALYYISDDLLADKEYDLLASALKINNKTYTDFTALQLKNGEKEEVTISIVKQAIIDTIVKLIEENIYEK